MIQPMNMKGRGIPKSRTEKLVDHNRGSMSRFVTGVPASGEIQEGEHVEAFVDGELRTYTKRFGKIYYTTATESGA